MVGYIYIYIYCVCRKPSSANLQGRKDGRGGDCGLWIAKGRGEEDQIGGRWSGASVDESTPSEHRGISLSDEVSVLVLPILTYVQLKTFSGRVPDDTFFLFINLLIPARVHIQVRVSKRGGQTKARI